MKDEKKTRMNTGQGRIGLLFCVCVCFEVAASASFVACEGGGPSSFGDKQEQFLAGH